MKKTTTTIIALALILSSCSETTDVKTESTDANKTEEVIEASVEKGTEELTPEGTTVEEDHRFDNLSKESASSPCQIVGHFTDNDINYVTVDLVNITQGDENSRYGIENDDLKQRTFVVNDEYLDIYTDANVSIETIFEKASKNPEMLVVIVAEDGLVTELYEMETESINQ
jgi:hypothetical protein